jgi:hypothetical protein
MWAERLGSGCIERKAMAWKIEQWMRQLYPGKKRLFSEYGKLKPREIVLVTASVIDAALAELLSRRLNYHSKEIESFLGLNADGRAPAGSFGARIQLALLVGLISDTDAKVFRHVQNIRNEFSHRVSVDIDSPHILQEIVKLCELLIACCPKTKNGLKAAKALSSLLQQIKRKPRKAKELFETILVSYQMFFEKAYWKIERVGLANSKKTDHPDTQFLLPLYQMPMTTQ